MSAHFADPTHTSIPLYLIAQDQLSDWLKTQSGPVAAWVDINGFTGGLGQALAMPNPDGTLQCALAGYGTPSTRERGRFHLAGAATNLPTGVYHLESSLAPAELAIESLGRLLALIVSTVMPGLRR